MATPKSTILTSVRKTASGLRKAGLVDKATMREFDVLCLTPVEPLTPEEIRALHEREQVSQPVFAHSEGRRQQMGARGEAARWAVAQTARSGEGERSAGNRLML